jgi:hypothetical protein
MAVMANTHAGGSITLNNNDPFSHPVKQILEHSGHLRAEWRYLLSLQAC